MSTGNSGLWDDCSDSRECVPGTGCYAHVTLWTCRPWCEIGSHFCPLGCFAHVPEVYYDGVHIGSCYY